MKKYNKIVPDTSTIIEGVLSKKLEKNEISLKQLLVHNAVVQELEHQANQNMSKGFMGIDELKKLRKLSEKHDFEIHFSGDKLKPVDIKYASLGEIDAKIRELAYDSGAVLITSDKVQSKIAESKGISVELIKIEYTKKKIVLEKFFDESTMSVHLKENLIPYAKKGFPGKWDFVPIGKKKLTHEELIELSRIIVEQTSEMNNSFIEIERPGSTIVQLQNYRIVITKPPFSDGWEITAVRPVKKLNLNDYNLSEKMHNRIETQAEGMLIAGAPGHGKSTFAQALGEFYAKKDKIVKTVEAPRDLQLSDAITQYAISHGTPQEIHDILLLSRPDYTIFDEMRNTDDFSLFADMRLSGVGMVGVIHATNPIDAVQRFIGRIELGVIPHVIDTVIFIKNGQVDRVLEVKMRVKVPAGMTEADLSRPVVVVSNFETGQPEFEIYSYGEETVVVPLKDIKQAEESPVKKFASERIRQLVEKYVHVIDLKMVSDNSVKIIIPKKDVPRIIGKEGKNIKKLEDEIGIHIDIEGLESNKIIETEKTDFKKLNFSNEITKTKVRLVVDETYSGTYAKIFLNNKPFTQARIDKKGRISFKKESENGRRIIKAIKKGEQLEIFVE